MMRSLRILREDIDIATDTIQRSLNVIEACIFMVDSDDYSDLCAGGCLTHLIEAKANIQAVVDVYMRVELNDE